MINSTIKINTGKCLDCPEDAPYRPLIAKRCQTHYKIFRTEQNAIKNRKTEWKTEKRKEMNAFLNKPRKPIPKVSKKRKIENKQYTVKRLQFLAQPRNQRCPVTGQIASEIHHMKGRVGDLLLDQKYWLAVSREGHRKIEENPDWAKEMGYSISRI